MRALVNIHVCVYSNIGHGIAPLAEITLNSLVLIRSESCWCRQSDALSTCRIPLSLHARLDTMTPTPRIAMCNPRSYPPTSRTPPPSSPLPPAPPAKV